ncbi:MAG: glycerol-3-phosphate 1-O-acyltransferase PlsY [Caldicoprobacterales bacterium]|jgi:glycerol-3-phosphate acyltransferase PlsY|nr:glycerol-3-phosphate 1-O-acyltransferase PlsY [Clostridiales bacterium]
MRYILIALIGYLLGNISSSYLVGKLMAKIDVREHGSGNLGATNVYRVLGLRAGGIVFLTDTLKGLLATLIGIWLKGDIGGLVGGIAAVAGHNWPFLLGFKGGKGIATSFGSIVILFPIISLILFIVELLVIAFTGYVSLASITVAALFPILVIVFRYSIKHIIGAFILAILAIYRHRSNISRLLKGQENKITSRKNGVGRLR